MFDNAYRGRRVLVTGHTGFKGFWLTRWLLALGADVAGLATPPPTEPSGFEALGLSERITDIRGDIRDREAVMRTVESIQPEVVFHLAAQSLVRRSYADPAATFESNALGTMNVCEAVRRSDSAQALVLITSDKCYKNVEWEFGYRETDALGGFDPYSASKGCAEIIAASYFESFFRPAVRPQAATTRAGNVIGGGDWAQDRIVPDCARAWAAGEPVRIRSPQATRPWQHVLEPLSGYLWLGARLLAEDPAACFQAFNFGPPAEVVQTVEEVARALEEQWPGFEAAMDSAGQGGAKESTLLKLCCDKALARLRWRAVLDFPTTMRMTAGWYRMFYEHGGRGIEDFTLDQIREYQDRARREGLAWTR
jgi:CDP-glucose 4,6-dehydratase